MRMRALICSAAALFFAARVAEHRPVAAEEISEIDRGVVLARNGDLEAALRSFVSVLAKDPLHLAAMNDAANTYLLLGETERAIDLYQRGLELHPQSPGLHLNLGIALYLNGTEPQARDHIRKAMWSFPDPQELLRVLGLAMDDSRRGSDAARDSSRQRKEFDLRAVLLEAARSTQADSVTAESRRVLVTAPSSDAAPDADDTETSRPGAAAGSRASRPDSSLSMLPLYWMGSAGVEQDEDP